MKFGIVNFPGSSGFSDAVYALHYVLEQDVVELWHGNTDLQGVDAVILPSGSSFGDFPSPGATGAKSPIIDPIKRFANNNGIVLGIGNGFQILCHTGLLNGSLINNKSGTFTGKNIFVKPDNINTHLSKLLRKEEVLQLPIAHACGCFNADNETMRKLHQNGQILLRYCSDDGKITADANPNGSIDNIAAISNETRNVFGIMACIERAVDPDLGNVNGLLMFQGFLDRN